MARLVPEGPQSRLCSSRTLCPGGCPGPSALRQAFPVWFHKDCLSLVRCKAWENLGPGGAGEEKPKAPPDQRSLSAWACCPAGRIWGQGLAGTDSPQASLRAAQDGKTAQRRRGRRRASLCVLHSQPKEGGGEGLCLTAPAVPGGLPWAGGSGSDTKDATLWFSEARSERYAYGPLCPAAPTRPVGRALRHLPGCPRPAAATPAPPCRVVFLSPSGSQRTN